MDAVDGDVGQSDVLVGAGDLVPDGGDLQLEAERSRFTAASVTLAPVATS